MEKQAKTHCYKKSLDYFNEVCMQDSFKAAVFAIQKKYFPKDKWVLNWDDEEEVDFDAGVPAMEEFGDYQTPEMEQDIYDNILKKFELPAYFYTTLWYHIFCGTDTDQFLNKDGQLGLCKTVELPELPKWKNKELHKKLENETYPVAIKVSPYASKRDILDYVQKSFDKVIKPIQDKHADQKSKVGKIRSKNRAVEIRNDYIYSGGQTLSLPEYIRSLAQLLKPLQIANFDTCYNILEKAGLLVLA